MIFVFTSKLNRRNSPLLNAVLLTLFVAAISSGQVRDLGIDSDPSAGMRRGTNIISGKVTLPSGEQVPKRCTVRLSSVHVGDLSTMTDDNGVFTFRRLREGSYLIRVEAGKEFLPAQETVDFFDNRGRTTTLQIQLRPKLSEVRVGVVNAKLAGVPGPALALYNKALASAAAHDHKKAVEQLKAALQIHPQFVSALNELSIAYLNLAESEKAAEALSQAVKLEPENSQLRFNLGYLLMQMKKYPEAETELRRATELTSNHSLAHLYLGRVLVSLHRLNEAEKELKRVIELGGDSVPLAYRYLGALYAEAEAYPWAIEALEKYLKLAPQAKDAQSVREIVQELKDKQTRRKN
jgi:predicted Zn-dependent protease